MIVVYIIVGGVIWTLLQNGIMKISPRFGWYIFLTGYLIISGICVYEFAGFSNKFAIWQRIIALLVFIASTILRVLYYRGRLLPDKK
jgi:hypothetical protein